VLCDILRSIESPQIYSTRISVCERCRSHRSIIYVRSRLVITVIEQSLGVQ
jgi:hypothetical protein